LPISDLRERVSRVDATHRSKSSAEAVKLRGARSARLLATTRNVHLKHAVANFRADFPVIFSNTSGEHDQLDAVREQHFDP
jgi:hypothetical protein